MRALNPLYSKKLDIVDWATSMEAKDSETQSGLQKRLLLEWRKHPMLGYFPVDVKGERHEIASRVVVNAVTNQVRETM